MTNRLAFGAIFSLFSFACAAASDELPDESAETTAKHEGAIINGSLVSAALNPSVVALYHQNICENDNPTCTPGRWHWYPRPCTATVLRSLPGESWVLTARHCVNDTGEIVGNVVSPNQLVVNTSVSPGIANPAPPAGGFGVDFVVPYTFNANSSAYDVALVHVPFQLPISSQRLSIARTGDLSRPLTVFGYGRSVVGEATGHIENGATGAGTLRTATGFPVVSTSTGQYSYINTNAFSQQIWRGDSGGPTFVTGASVPFYELVGVHSTARAATPPRATDFSIDERARFAWLQANLGHVYLSPHSLPAWRLGVNGGVPQNGAEVTVQSTLDAVGTRWFHTSDLGGNIIIRDSSGRIHYLTVSPNGFGGFNLTLSRFIQNPASGQMWTLDSGYQIRNGTTGVGGAGLCLQHETNNRVTVAQCSGSVRQRWSWRAQP